MEAHLLARVATGDVIGPGVDVLQHGEEGGEPMIAAAAAQGAPELQTDERAEGALAGEASALSEARRRRDA